MDRRTNARAPQEVSAMDKSHKFSQSEIRMAASSANKPSPSNGGATATEEGNSKAAAASSTPVTETVAAVTTTTTTTATTASNGGSATTATTSLKAPPPESQSQSTNKKVPTYQDSEASEHYTVALSFLKAGEFEQALVTTEQGLEETRRKLLTTFANECDDPEMHESMAPFHYLYGTTLLYSIEEASPDNANAQAMTTLQETAAAAGRDVAAACGDEEEEYEEEADVPMDNADDMEIAWENLETARAILQSMLPSSSNNNIDASKREKIQLDLAQVHLREGDLQRLNGRYEAAISDYEACLKLRQEASTNNTQMIGPYDRKIADVHYNLGLVYMLQVAEMPRQQQEQQQMIQDGTSTTDAPTCLLTEAQLAKKLEFYRRRSYHHSFLCGKTLCGQIAFLCNVEPNDLFARAFSDIPAFKTTGEEEHVDEDHPMICSAKLKSLRKHVALLQPSSTFSEDDQDLVRELQELLEEIQETIDEAENSEEGVHKVVEMKQAIAAAVAAQEEPDNGNTGEASSTTAAAFGSVQAAASTATAQTIMAVKKKKKRDAPEPGNVDDEAKMPAAAAADAAPAKRAHWSTE